MTALFTSSLQTPRRSRLRQHRDLREDEAFLVRHYAGTNSLEFLVQQSSAKFIRELFDGRRSAETEPTPGRRSGGGRLQASTVGGKFRAQLTVLLDKLKNTGTHFVRCVKPNSSMSAGVCDGAAILSQLKCAGMTSVLKLMKKGFSSRVCVKGAEDGQRSERQMGGLIQTVRVEKTHTGQDIYNKEEGRGGINQSGRKATREGEEVHEEGALNSGGVARQLERLRSKRSGLRRVSAGGMGSKESGAELLGGSLGLALAVGREQLVEYQPLFGWRYWGDCVQGDNEMAKFLLKLQFYLFGKRPSYHPRRLVSGSGEGVEVHSKKEWPGKSPIELSSSSESNHIFAVTLFRKQFKPRLDLYRKSLSLLNRSYEMMSVINQLQPSGREKWVGPVRDTTKNLENLVKNIRLGNQFSYELDRALSCYEQCVKSVDHTISELKKQLVIDEQQRRLHEIERKRHEEEEEEARKRDEEGRLDHERQQRKQLEEKREKEEQRYQQTMAADAKQAEAFRIAEEQRLAAAERERLDTIIATRLSQDSGRAMIDTPTTSMSSSISSIDSSKPRSRYDLSSWRYAELRDAINTSTDMDLLLACKEEFHRRLRIYNAWKSRNLSESDTTAAPRAPNAVYTNAQKRSIVAPQVNPALTMQRYFKVPFTRPADIYKNNNNNGLITDSRVVQNGLWYAHFNGQWIQRQIEMHPNKTPVLLVAGRDDLRMCEIPLDQTGLTRKKGAEILESEFETVWLHLGGAPMQKWRP
ncbi:hypothetical protein KIN20_003849 [Parelaphostrongylus tenuis]|uniref:Myosin motor domain-containing protein n=1 Tax=Parelaphostrongylus tenuis TaxID=148309 RepID=A0AAD5MJ07_PARTN|nr:hypothetical protein KIN20_003849 [Parelaphostrongylus tenuis]